jgi:hypothetical protein
MEYKMSEKLIIGAGLAGLITACRIKDAPIFEAGKRTEQHHALLRFRDKSVSELTGIPFQEVTVHKEVSYKGATHHQCSIAMANMYARKVSGSYRGRSIWNLETVKRYVAPPDFYDQLANRHANRIEWNHPITAIERGRISQMISTIPLPAMMKACGMDELKFEFQKSAIRVNRFKLPKGSQVYQTIYYPDHDLRVFRASITGDLLIVESMTGQPVDEFVWRGDSFDEMRYVALTFGITLDDLEPLDVVDQKYGKIVELPREQREAILYELTRDFNVFSIGRFATWRNILLDDVAKDIGMVEKLMNASTYGRGLVLANR